MKNNEATNTPLLAGWAIAIGVGLVGTAVSFLIVGVEGNGSVAIGAVLALVVGLILGMPMRPLPPPNSVILPRGTASKPMTDAKPAAAAASASQPVTPPEPASPVPPAPAASSTVPVSAAATVVATEPAPAPPPMTKPESLAQARDGKPDDLQQIRGIGPKMEEMLHGMGFFHFDQIAAWTEIELAWVDHNLEGFKGRASRDEWVVQARTLAGGGTPELVTRQD